MESDGSQPSLSLRLLVQGKEVGSIIGKKGEIVKRFREESGAKIYISDGSCPERVVTIVGNPESILTAFKLICARFEEFFCQINSSGSQQAPIILRLIVPSSQCSSLIGKGGSKIKEIREMTGASIQVASDMLPNSTERAVTISGTSEAITQCIYHICDIMIEFPPKGSTIPFRPKPQTAGGPVILADGQAYTIQGRYAVPSAPDLNKLTNSPLASLLSLGNLAASNSNLPNSALAALAGSQLRAPTGTGSGPQTHEMTVPNELIGCIIGKGGTKIAEIRQITGAMITISKYDDGSEDASKQERRITIKGNEDQVTLAQNLINTSMELHKAQLEVGKGSTGSGVGSIPLAQLLKNHQVLSTLSSLTGMQGLTSLNSLFTPDSSQGLTPSAMAAQRHKSLQSKIHPSASNQSASSNDSPKDSKRSKFAPY